MTAKALRGEDLSKGRVELPDKMDLFVNEAASETIGIDIPESVLSRATKIIESKKAP